MSHKSWGPLISGLLKKDAVTFKILMLFRWAFYALFGLKVVRIGKEKDERGTVTKKAVVPRSYVGNKII